ncbi:M81 family metallopeptidase [Xanthomonas sacchari]|uniref:M81 family metallopeptidase n=1 Tax=Xanthomonas sacchari TaxID=56458 RepID=UPI0020C42EEA|nr:M81 family metallopeptidase [Xanthomonas sacchari]
MRIFTAMLATETNTFSPVPTDMASFRAGLYAGPGQHPPTPTLCSAPITVLRQRARAEGFELIEGTAAWAEPGGMVQRATYEHLRDEILEQLRQALPVQAVVLGLHGAMVAQGYDDCEGDLLQRVRALVGADTIVAAELDPHSHLTPLRVRSADLLAAFLEFPHTDFVERAEHLVELTLQAVAGSIRPRQAVFDCRMIDVFPTSIEPMRGFVDRLKRLQGHDRILSISVIHGFMAGDVPDMGTQVLVVTDDAQAQGLALARTLGEELFALRGRTMVRQYGIDQGLDLALQAVAAGSGRPVVVADVWDNPGGGVAGDGTLILHRMLERGIDDLALAPLWDPIAVSFCHAAGVGAQLTLRFGGKCGATAGAPIDADVQVIALSQDAWQSFGDSRVPLGSSATVRLCGSRIDVVLTSHRAQTYSPDVFSNQGVDVAGKSLLLVKSTNHFHAAFAPIAAKVIYIDAGAPYPSDPRRTDYRKLTRPIWPRAEDPHHLDATVIAAR